MRDEHSVLISDAQIACVRPNGVPIALGVESVMGARDPCGIHLSRMVETAVLDPGSVADFDAGRVKGRRVILVNEGVETGTAAKVCGDWLKSLGVLELELAVPVCTRTAMNQLQFLFSSIVTVQAPLSARSLAWHYTDFDVIDQESGIALLDARSKALGQ